MKKTTLLFVLLSLAAVTIAACAPAATMSFDGEPGFYPEELVAEEAMAPSLRQAEIDMAASGGEDAFAPNDAALAQAEARVVIKTASLTLVVDSPEASLDAITALADRLGGFVVSSNIYDNGYGFDRSSLSAYITIRVPSASFDDALEDIRSEAIDVRTDNRSGQDVTAEYTDLQSRLRNLRDAEAMLRGIMQDATDTEDVLAAFNQLNYITEQIEVLVGQIQYYEESAAMSSISVELIANESVQPISVGPWDISGAAKDAIEALVKALQGIAEALVWFFLYVIPVLVVIALPLLLIGWGVRKALTLRKPKAAKPKAARK
jgi:hypothetical protein